MRTFALTLIALWSVGCSAPKADANYDLVNMADQRALPSSDELLDPDRQPRTPAPNQFVVEVITTKGAFTLEIYRDWSPLGVDRFHHLVSIGYYTDIAIFRAIQSFMFQFGIHGEPMVNDAWQDATIAADPLHPDASNIEGAITYAQTADPNSRTTQLFINLGNNSRLDTQGFVPFGRVIEGMEVVRQINTEYGENRAPNFQGNFQEQGNSYVKEVYPNLDYILSMTVTQ